MVVSARRGLWEGWLEFEPDDASPVLRTSRETTQPKLTDLKYWASGLSAVNLEGAFSRAVAAKVAYEVPTYEEPAPARSEALEPEMTDEPVLDPFSVYADGEEVLRGRLAVLDRPFLLSIVRAFELIEPTELDLDALDETSLIDLIVTAVRKRLAADWTLARAIRRTLVEIKDGWRGVRLVAPLRDPKSPHGQAVLRHAHRSALPEHNCPREVASVVDKNRPPILLEASADLKDGTH